MELNVHPVGRDYRITLINNAPAAQLFLLTLRNIQRLDNVLDGFTTNLNACQAQLENMKTQMEAAKVQVENPFPYEEEFQTKSARLAEFNATLDMDKHENEITDIDTLEAPQSRGLEPAR